MYNLRREICIVYIVYSTKILLIIIYPNSEYCLHHNLIEILPDLHIMNISIIYSCLLSKCIYIGETKSLFVLEKGIYIYACMYIHAYINIMQLERICKQKMLFIKGNIEMLAKNLRKCKAMNFLTLPDLLVTTDLPSGGLAQKH